MSRLIIVLGMHRSGSSLVTKSLECLGVSLGDRADWTAPDNPTGFHEDLDILAIDEAVLKRCGSAWDQPLDLGRAVFLSDLEVVAKRTLGDKLERFPLFGVKDPRLCRLLPFWLPVINRIGCDVGVVQVFRTPFAIADSLVKRNGRDRSYWLKMEQEHHRCAGLAIPKKDGFPLWPIASVSYESMCGLHPDIEVRHIAKELGLTVDQEKLAQFCSEFVRKPNAIA
jgi:hypothetical protein